MKKKAPKKPAMKQVAPIRTIDTSELERVSGGMGGDGGGPIAQSPIGER
jgi:hypothetical protein